MKTFFVRIISIFVLLLTAYLPSSAQPCKVTITGNNCLGDTLNANFTGGILSNLEWTRSEEEEYIDQDYESPYFYANLQTVAGGNGSGSAPNQLSYPTSVFADAHGNIYVADTHNWRVQKWAPGATSGVTVAGGNGEGDAANQLSSPEGVFVDAHGNIYVADANNWRVQKWAPGATSGITVAGGNGFGSDANQLTPTGVFVDGAGNIYVADKSNNRIQKWKPGANKGTTVAGGNGYGAALNQLAFPESIYVDSGKNIYIADNSNHRIQKWKPGAASGITVAGGNGQGSADNQLSFPASVYVNSSGTLFIADTYNDRIQKWEKGGVNGTTIDPGWPNILSEPYSVSIDPDGNIYVADKDNSRVRKYLSKVTNTTFVPDAPYGMYRAIATSSTGCIDTSNKISVSQCGAGLCNGRPYGCTLWDPVLSIKGLAPAPWAIDGAVEDWETILGPNRKDPSLPFCPPWGHAQNWSIDGYIRELDTPDSTRDLNFSAFIHDDYNVYFYLHRLKNGYGQNNFYYFFDVNADGYLDYGEPVVQATFSKNYISALTISSYVPNTNKFYVEGKGNNMVSTEPYGPDYNFLLVEKFPAPGTLNKLFSSDSIPKYERLTAKEKFAAAITENGYGVELAVPWKYLKNWVAANQIQSKGNTISKRNTIFTYKLSLQKGVAAYNANKIADNAGSCRSSFIKSGSVNISDSTSVETLVPDSSYRFKVTYTNPTNVPEEVGMREISLSQLHFTAKGQVLAENFKTNVYRDSNCNGTVDDGEVPEAYGSGSSSGDGVLHHGDSISTGLVHSNDGIMITVPAFGSSCVIVDITMPDNATLNSCDFLIQSSIDFKFDWPEYGEHSGSRVINPVGNAKTKVVNKKFSLNVSENNISVDKPVSDNDVKVYPNPNDGTAIVSLPVDKNIANAVLYDMYGNILHNWNNVDLYKIHITGLTNGSYFLKVNFQNGKTVTKKIIVNK